jgi:hypothetical protein
MRSWDDDRVLTIRDSLVSTHTDLPTLSLLLDRPIIRARRRLPTSVRNLFIEQTPKSLQEPKSKAPRLNRLMNRLRGLIPKRSQDSEPALPSRNHRNMDEYPGGVPTPRIEPVQPPLEPETLDPMLAELDGALQRLRFRNRE